MKSLYLSVSLKAIENCDGVKYEKDDDESNRYFRFSAIISDLNHEAYANEGLKARKQAEDLVKHDVAEIRTRQSIL